MFQNRYVDLSDFDMENAVSVTEITIDRSPDPTEPDYTDEQRATRNRRSSRTSLIAAAASALMGGMGVSTMDYSSFRAPFAAFNFYSSLCHTDYQFSHWPRTMSTIAMKKGRYQQAQQTRWKTLQKRYEKKTKRAKGKVPIYPY